MKFVSLVTAFTFLITADLIAQRYRTLDDNPEKLIRGHVAVEYMTIDAGFKNLSGAYAWAVGVNAYYPILPSLGIEGSIRTPLLKFESSDGFAVAFEGGASKTLLSKTKLKKEVTVLMKFRQSRSLGGSSVATSTLTIPGNVKTEVFARGGVYHRNSAFEYDLPSGFAGFSTITHTGGYLGVGISKGKFFQFQSVDSEQKVAIGSIFKFYADVLILPTNVQEPTFNDSDSIGWRIGVKWYNSPFTADNNFGQKKGFFGNMFALLELGTRPHEGTVVTTSIGYIIKRF